MPLLSVDSPCIGFCSTVYGDDVCRGCNRYFEEVVHWQELDSTERRATLQRIHRLMQQVVDEYLSIIDADLLDQRLQRHNVPLPEMDSPQARVLALLYAGAHQMRDLAAYGLQATPRAAGMSAQDIKMAMVQRRVELAQPGYAEWQDGFFERKDAAHDAAGNPG